MQKHLSISTIENVKMVLQNSRQTSYKKLKEYRELNHIDFCVISLKA
jgi:hypothetical protein